MRISVRYIGGENVWKVKKIPLLSVISFSIVVSLRSLVNGPLNTVLIMPYLQTHCRMIFFNRQPCVQWSEPPNRNRGWLCTGGYIDRGRASVDSACFVNACKNVINLWKIDWCLCVCLARLVQGTCRKFGGRRVIHTYIIQQFLKSNRLLNVQIELYRFFYLFWWSFCRFYYY